MVTEGEMWGEEGGERNQKPGRNTHILPYIREITNKDLLYIAQGTLLNTL